LATKRQLSPPHPQRLILVAFFAKVDVITLFPLFKREESIPRQAQPPVLFVRPPRLISYLSRISSPTNVQLLSGRMLLTIFALLAVALVVAYVWYYYHYIPKCNAPYLPAKFLVGHALDFNVDNMHLFTERGVRISLLFLLLLLHALCLSLPLLPPPSFPPPLTLSHTPPKRNNRNSFTHYIQIKPLQCN